MKRREFPGVLSGALALPLTAGAQQPAKSWRIAYLALLPGENVERPLIRQRSGAGARGNSDQGVLPLPPHGDAGRVVVCGYLRRLISAT